MSEPLAPETTPALEVRASETIDAPAAEVARRCCDFGALHAWHPAFRRCVVDGEGVGAVRTLDMGGAAVRERLEQLDEAGAGYSYRVLQHPLLAGGSRGSLAVRSAGEGQSVLEWIVALEPGGVLPPATLAELIRGLCAMGLAAAKHALESGEPIEPGHHPVEPTDISWDDDKTEMSWSDDGMTVPDLDPSER